MSVVVVSTLEALYLSTTSGQIKAMRNNILYLFIIFFFVYMSDYCSVAYESAQILYLLAETGNKIIKYLTFWLLIMFTVRM